MKYFLSALLFFLITFPLHPDTVKNTLSSEYTRKDFTDQTSLSGVVFEDTLSWKIPDLPVLLLKGYFELQEDLQKTGGGIGTVFTYFDNFYSEISYVYLLSGDIPLHRIYCDSTFEDHWGYLTLSARADFSTANVLLSSFGIKNYLSEEFSLWNRYTLAVSTSEEIKNGWWTEVQYQLNEVFTLKTGITAEWPASALLPEWQQLEILAGLSIKPSEILYISYQAAFSQPQYAFQQKHTIVLTLTFNKD